jgi:hypothetical protein
MPTTPQDLLRSGPDTFGTASYSMATIVLSPASRFAERERVGPHCQGTSSVRSLEPSLRSRPPGPMAVDSETTS